MSERENEDVWLNSYYHTLKTGETWFYTIGTKISPFANRFAKVVRGSGKKYQ